MDLTRPRDIQIEIDSVELSDSGLGDVDAIESSIAGRLDGQSDVLPSVAAAIARSIRAEVGDGD